MSGSDLALADDRGRLETTDSVLAFVRPESPLAVAATSGGAVLVPSGWRAMWRNLSYCWCDPDATVEVAAAYRVRQTQALLQQTPLSSFNCVAFALIIAWLFWDKADQGLLSAWVGIVTVSSGISLSIWHRCRKASNKQLCTHTAPVQTVLIAISGLQFSVMPTYLFGDADLNGKFLLLAIAAGFVAHGAMQSARWPWAGITWAGAMCIGGSAAMLHFYGDRYLFLAGLTIFYYPIVIVSVLLTSRLFVRSLMDETKIERQKQVIGLLLNDFEDDASDWLWETDQQGLICHASGRLAAALGVSLSSLRGQSMTGALFGADSLSGAEGRHAIHYLGHCLRRVTPFRDIEVPIGSGDSLRWWSLSGKPLLAAGGSVTGWRGVGTDITAERKRQQAEQDLHASREAAAHFAGELDAARRIQMGLLPDLANILATESRLLVAAILEPALEVGGDYYECFWLDQNRLCFAVADVSGKGVPASLFMAMTKTLAAALARRGTELGQVVREIANELDRKNPEMLFVTSLIAVLDAENGELTCVSAGHDAPALLRDGQCLRLDLGEALGPPLCGVPDYPFQSIKFQLQPGDTLCLFTDGVTEASNGPGFYGADRLAQALLAQAGDASVDVCADSLRNSVRAFEAGQPPADDLTIMVLRWLGTKQAPVSHN